MTTMTTFTKGTVINGGQLARIYDRLRKRSLRAHKALDNVADLQVWGDDQVTEIYALMDRIELDQYGTACPSPHVAYVRGVRDALAAVEKEAL